MSSTHENGKRLDPVTFEVLRSSFEYVCGRMSTVLQKASFSPIIYDMVDFSNAIYNEKLELLGQTANCPVHIAAMHFSAQASVKHFGFESLRPGDIFVLNDPYDGGTHLPDLTLVLPVFAGGGRRPAFYVANRAHHADVGGTYPGSMGLCREIYQEGVRIPPLLIAREGRLDRSLMALILNNVRTPREREGDLTAQIGACRIGAQRLEQMVAKYGRPRVERDRRPDAHRPVAQPVVVEAILGAENPRRHAPQFRPH